MSDVTKDRCLARLAVSVTKRSKGSVKGTPSKTVISTPKSKTVVSPGLVTVTSQLVKDRPQRKVYQATIDRILDIGHDSTKKFSNSQNKSILPISGKFILSKHFVVSSCFSGLAGPDESQSTTPANPLPPLVTQSHGSVAAGL